MIVITNALKLSTQFKHTFECGDSMEDTPKLIRTYCSLL